MTTRRCGVALAAVLAVAAPAGALAQGEFEARLSGFQEVPSISTNGTGRFTATVVGSGADTRIEYELTYSGLSAQTTVAHIHFAQRGVVGAVSAFLCGGGNKPGCPAQGTVTGTIVASDVTGPDARGIAPGEIQELVRAMRAGATYANVHSTTFQDGEIRGQIVELVE
jgi:CHRD domain